MKIVMMGTGGFAVPTFHAILASDHEVVSLVTRPARRGRGGRPPKNPMREAGEATQLSIIEPVSINDDDAIALVRAMDADLMVVCDYGQILSPAALATTRLGGINLHASLLPEYRGAAPIHWAIFDGKQETGVSVIHMTPRLDSGPVLLQETTRIGASETAGELEIRLADLGASAVIRAIEHLENWDGSSPMGNMQLEKAATKAPRLKKLDGQVDWHRSAQQICNQIRAFQPWPRTYTFLSRGRQRTRLIIDRAKRRSLVQPAPPGTILDSGDDCLCVATQEGALELEIVQPEGKKRMSGAEFRRGYQIHAGTVLES